VLEAAAVGAILAGPPFAIFSLLPDHLRTVLAVKGSLRRAQQRRALDRSGPFYSKPSHQEGKAHCGRGATSPPFWPLFSPPPTAKAIGQATACARTDCGAG
jgi:hypothetical protein